MKWPCRMQGSINKIDGKIARVDRIFEGAGDVRAAALITLAKRKDKGSPWYGDAIEVITPLGQTVIVEVPWPEIIG